MSKHDELIQSLSQDLAAVKRPSAPSVRLLVWTLFSIAVVTTLTHISGELRPGFAQQLSAHPRFLIETLIGLCAALLAAFTGIILAIPGAGESKLLVRATITSFVVWVLFFVYGLFDPAITPSMTGKRPHCFQETLIFSIPPLLILLLLVRQGATIMRTLAGSIIGLSACLLPATAMQIACMYDPLHILKFHVGPVIIIATICALMGRFLFRKV